MHFGALLVQQVCRAELCGWLFRQNLGKDFGDENSDLETR